MEQELKTIKSKRLMDSSGKCYKVLAIVNLPLNDLFDNVRKKEHNEPYEYGEYYLSIKSKKGYESRAVKLSPTFQNWLKINTFQDCGHSFELIQQQKTIGDKPPYDFKYLPSFLLVMQYSSILGGHWINYFTEKQVKEFFRI